MKTTAFISSALLTVALTLSGGAAFAKSGSKGGGSKSSGSHSKSSSKGGSPGGSHGVKGYTKKDGTYVAPHRQTNSDKSKANNYSSKGNVNPNTGKEGTKDPNKP